MITAPLINVATVINLSSTDRRRAAEPQLNPTIYSCQRYYRRLIYEKMKGLGLQGRE